jgi:hypothetical protein
MVWRRVLVPTTFTLRELHGVIQLAMGWEGIHLYVFQLRAARYGSRELSASSPDVTLAALRFRKGARFIYEYDLNIPWRHEVRIEDRLEPEARKTYPVRIGGDGACPPEDCGGPETGRRWSRSTKRRAGGWRMLWSGPRLGRKPRADRFRGGKSTPVLAMASTTTSCTSSGGEALRPPLCEQVGGEQRRFVPLPLPDAGDQRVGGRISQLIEPALQRGGCRFRIKTGGGDECKPVALEGS